MSQWWSTGQVNMLANMQAAAYRKPPKEEHTTTKALCTPLHSHLVSFLHREKVIAAYFFFPHKLMNLLGKQRTVIGVRFRAVSRLIVLVVAG